MKNEFELHSFEYLHDGGAWIIEIPATSEADAWQRICRMQDATHLGVVQLKVPDNIGLLAKAIALAQRLAFKTLSNEQSKVTY